MDAVDDLDLEVWLRHVFDHPVTEPQWYFQCENEEPSDLRLARIVENMTRLFEAPERLLTEYTQEQIAQGLWYLNWASRPFMPALLSDDVPWPLCQRGLLSMESLFRRLFAVACTDELGHTAFDDSSPINTICYMWWDLFPTWGSRTMLRAGKSIKSFWVLLREHLRSPRKHVGKALCTGSATGSTLILTKCCELLTNSWGVIPGLATICVNLL